MRRSSLVWLSLPLLLSASCLLPSFDNVPARPHGVAGHAGESDGGMGPLPTAGSAGEPGEGNGGAVIVSGGAGGAEPDAPPAPVTMPDVFVVAQGKTLQIAAKSGVLSNDTPALHVSSFAHAASTRPKAFDASVDIAADGSLTFKPAAAFFGRYEVEYVASDEQGQNVTGQVTFVVQPSAVALDSVAAGVGGITLGGGAGEGVGAALVALGDVNADGVDDFAVGAPGAGNGRGSVYVVFGGAKLATLSLAALTPESTEQRYAVLTGTMDAPIGSYVASAGRYNADASPDLVIGSPDVGGGRVFVAYGGSALKNSLELPGMGPERGVSVAGIDVGSRLGERVAGGADFDGDQKVDFVAGVHRGGGSKGGLCFVLDRPSSDQDVDKTHVGWLSDSNLYELPQSLAFAGDVDGDGKADVLASSKRHVALLFGMSDPASLPTDVSQLVTQQAGLLRVRENGVTDAAPVASAGDINADDHDDFAFCDQFGATDVRCHVLLGPHDRQSSLDKPDWQLTGFASPPALPLLGTGADMNQDDFADLLVADASAAYVIYGRDAGFGTVNVKSLGSDGFSLAIPAGSKLAAIAPIGDVNADGYADIALGEPAADGGAGRVYIVFGGPYAPAQR